MATNQRHRDGNRLTEEKSPYLRQHMHNPVDWYPWGDTAFAKAEAEDKPVFLSIGYSTCHWCHVMAEESFEDEQVADVLNSGFISIKVDKEERPDIDHLYMTVCQIMTGGGGWPLTVFLTPQKQPFFATTYIPKNSRFGRTGLLELIPKISWAWRKDRNTIVKSAKELTAHLRGIMNTSQADEPGEEALHRAYRGLVARYDPEHGGFGERIKFPTPHNLLFLLRYADRTGTKKAQAMAVHTLESMRRGGIFDHIGLGFHRYSTDRRWHVPHFEKMLYDQALLMLAYTEAYQSTGAPVMAEAVRDIADYALDQMAHPEGGFYSAEDADSQGQEGLFYLWTVSQVRDILDPADADLVVERFGLESNGNYEEEGTGERSGANILHIKASIEELAGRHSTTEGEVRTRLEQAVQLLKKNRERRPHPLRDEKILTDWNGLMIGALAQAGAVLNEPALTEASSRAARFIWDNLVTEDGLAHRFKDGHVAFPGQLSDYASLAFGLIELYQARFEELWLERAVDLTTEMFTRFSNAEGGLGMVSSADVELPVPPEDLYDGAIPCGASVAFYNAVRLFHMTGDAHFESLAAELARVFGRHTNHAPEHHAFFLVGLDFALGPTAQIVIATPRQGSDKEETKLVKATRKNYIPRKVVLVRRTDPQGSRMSQIAPFTAQQVAQQERATAYVCADHVCEEFVFSDSQMLEKIKRRLRS